MSVLWWLRWWLGGHFFLTAFTMFLAYAVMATTAPRTLFLDAAGENKASR